MDIKHLVVEFANQLSALIEGEATDRARSTVLAAFGVPPRRGPGRPPKSASPAVPVATKARRKGPIQLCPVPGCKNPAAPIFGVCAKHKDVKKSLVKKYREARKAKKVGKVVAKKAPKRRSKVVAKTAPKRRSKVVAKKAPKRRVSKAVAAKPVSSTSTAAAA